MIKYGDNIDELVTQLRISQAKQSAQIASLSQKVDEIHEDVKDIRKSLMATKISQLKDKAKLLGVGGAGGGVVMALIELVKHLT